MVEIRKLIISAALLIATNAFALDFSDIFSKNYKPEWVFMSEGFEIDKKSIVKNSKELGSASIKFFSRPRAREVGAALYDYTTFSLEFDCRQNEVKVSMVVDTYKTGAQSLVTVRDLDVWKPVTSTGTGPSLAFGYVCKR